MSIRFLAPAAALVCAAGACAQPSADPGPVAPDVRSVVLALDDGWWLHVAREGPHAIGYGALPQRVAVPADALDAGSLIGEIEPRARPRSGPPPADTACRFTAVFQRSGGDVDALSYALPEDLCPMLTRVFRQAWLLRDTTVAFGSDPATIERFWREAPFVRR